MIEIYEPLVMQNELYFLLGCFIGGLVPSLFLIYMGLDQFFKNRLQNGKKRDAEKALREAERIIKGKSL